MRWVLVTTIVAWAAFSATVTLADVESGPAVGQVVSSLKVSPVENGQPGQAIDVSVQHGEQLLVADNAWIRFAPLTDRPGLTALQCQL